MITTKKHSAQDLEEIFKILTQNNKPIELNFSNGFQLLIAVILSARTTDKAVNKATQNLFKIVHTPADMIELGVEKLESFINILGLYKTKAKRIIQTSDILIKKHNKQVPDNLDDLQQLPGVGRKTANVILNELFKQITFPVDTHVFRVANRLGLVKATNTLQTEQALKEQVPAKYALHAAHSMVLHGRYICKAVKPMCEQCPVQQYCEYYKLKIVIKS